MSETPKVRDLAQELEDSLTRAKEARDAKVSGDEHPSGLRDAIARGIERGSAVRNHPEDYIEIEVRAWLSVVSEGEIEAAARALNGTGVGYTFGLPTQWERLDELVREQFRAYVERVLVASRGVLVPRIESDENGGTK